MIIEGLLAAHIAMIAEPARRRKRRHYIVIRQSRLSPPPIPEPMLKVVKTIVIRPYFEEMWTHRIVEGLK